MSSFDPEGRYIPRLLKPSPTSSFFFRVPTRLATPPTPPPLSSLLAPRSSLLAPRSAFRRRRPHQRATTAERERIQAVVHEQLAREAKEHGWAISFASFKPKPKTAAPGVSPTPL